MSAISRLSEADYEEIKAVICPYCRAGLDDIRNADKHAWLHFIPDATDKFMLIRFSPTGARC